MINTPQDYRLVTPVGQIDGGILPARDVAADGSAHVLRAEDVCFLAEAASRAWAYYNFFDTHALQASLGASLCLDSSKVNAAHDTLLRCTEYGANRYVFLKAAPMRNEFVANVAGNSAISVVLGAIDPGIASVPNFIGDGASFALDNDDLRKVWYNYRQIGWIVATCSMEASGLALDGIMLCKAGGRRRMHYIDQQPGGWMAVTYATRVYEAWSMYSGTWGTHNGWLEYDYIVGTVKPSIGATSTNIAFAHGGDQALVIIRVESVYQTYDSSSGTLQNTVRYYDALACWGTIDTNGLLQISSFFHDDLTAERIRDFVFGAHGDIPRFNDMPNWRTLRIDIWPVAVFFSDAGINTSGINWQWTP
jgi:hypothetical protein